MYSITTGSDDNRDGQFTDRPEVGPWCPGTTGTGICERNSETGPGYFAMGFNLSKAFELGGGQQVSVFTNLNNAFNMTNLGTPSGTLTSRNFGRSTSASDPRRLQVGMRYQF
jgi:hypothetical protein